MKRGGGGGSNHMYQFKSIDRPKKLWFQSADPLYPPLCNLIDKSIKKLLLKLKSYTREANIFTNKSIPHLWFDTKTVDLLYFEVHTLFSAIEHILLPVIHTTETIGYTKEI